MVFIEKWGFHCRKQGRKWEVREDREKNKTKKKVERRKTGRKEGNYIKMQIQYKHQRDRAKSGPY